MLNGIAAACGIGIGRAYVIAETDTSYEKRTDCDPKNEIVRFEQALRKYSELCIEEAGRLEISIGKKEADIIRGHITIIKDPMLHGDIIKELASGSCAELAVEDTCARYEAVFASVEDEYTKQRAADIRDICSGMLDILTGRVKKVLSDLPRGTIIVANEIIPSMTAEMDAECICGIVAGTGGSASHAAIVAKALGIPAVLSVKNVTENIKDGDTVIVDGEKGCVIPLPDESTIERYISLREDIIRDRKDLEMYRGRKSLSADGKEFAVYCNIEKPQDAVRVVENDGEGIGLFRTEFIFADREEVPDEEEQFRAYRQAALILKGKPLVVRTIDIGGDKAAKCLSMNHEDNPFMGCRAIRYCLKKNPELFRTQLRAILRTSVYGNIRIMLPMITSVTELTEAKKIIESVKEELDTENIPYDKNIRTGIMIETPAAAVCADILAKEADFFSIGTNDLTGYTLACDRGNADVLYLYSANDTSVLRLIRYTIECAKKQGIPVGMCGEAAADMSMIPMLMSFGLDEFSVSPPCVLKVRRRISQFTIAQAAEVAEGLDK